MRRRRIEVQEPVVSPSGEVTGWRVVARGEEHVQGRDWSTTLASGALEEQPETAWHGSVWSHVQALEAEVRELRRQLHEAHQLLQARADRDALHRHGPRGGR